MAHERKPTQSIIKFIYSCSARRISFESDCFYGMWTWIYEYNSWLSRFFFMWFHALSDINPSFSVFILYIHPLPPIIASRNGPDQIYKPRTLACCISFYASWLKKSTTYSLNIWRGWRVWKKIYSRLQCRRFILFTYQITLKVSREREELCNRVTYFTVFHVLLGLKCRQLDFVALFCFLGHTHGQISHDKTSYYTYAKAKRFSRFPKK